MKKPELKNYLDKLDYEDMDVDEHEVQTRAEYHKDLMEWYEHELREVKLQRDSWHGIAGESALLRRERDEARKELQELQKLTEAPNANFLNLQKLVCAYFNSDYATILEKLLPKEV